MYIKILKSTDPDYWYSDCINELFEVESLDFNLIMNRKIYKVKHNLNLPRNVLQEDCIEIDETTSKGKIKFLMFKMGYE